MAYGANMRDLHRRVATFVDKILADARPLGLTFPPHLLAQAHHFVE